MNCPILKAKDRADPAVAGAQRQTLEGRTVVLSGVTEPSDEEILEILLKMAIVTPRIFKA